MECNICTRIVSTDEMHVDKRVNTGFSNTCESCFVEASRERKRLDKARYRTTPEYKAKYRAWQLKRYYGLTTERFDAIFESQGRACASCGSDTPRWTKGWCIDHDHTCCQVTPTCGKCVRGILCMPCNMTVGMMKESVDDLLAVVDYLNASKRAILVRGE